MKEILNIHQNILERFCTIEKKGLLAHAYLLIGPQEVGKFETALVLAKMLNCEKPGEGISCDQCASCLKIIKSNHPDVHVLQCEEDSSVIKIDQVRELLGQARLRPFEAKRKVFIIKDAEGMTPDAANALLKTLEEPTSTSVLLLTSSVPEKLLPTVRSRCQAVHFLSESSERILQYLEGKYVESFASSHFLSYFAEGCLKRAERLREEGFFEAKNEYLDEFLFRADSEAFIKEMSTDREKCQEFLKVLLSWVRDAILCKSGVADQRLIHLDRKKDLENFQVKFSFAQLNTIHDTVVLAYKQLTDNLNIRLSLMILREMIHG
ncbi:MAG TPA: DNA polymerase III subunit delta' [Candidatus Omnitrophota bacterium]|nr:DNA polymerase III subunit delta' [Candidatus Omnitrophota bacterium]